MSTPTTIAKYIPTGSSPIQKFVSSADDGTVFIDEVVEKSIYQPVTFSEDESISAVQKEQYHNSVKDVCNLLMIAFPKPINTESEKMQNSMFYSLLYKMVEKEMIPIDRLKDSVENIIKSQQKYKSFNIADIIGFDKKIILAKNKSALCRKLKRNILDVELAVTYEIVDGRVVRLLGLADDILSSPQYKDKILGVWDDNTHGWNWVGIVDDPSIKERQIKFYNSLGQFVNSPPKYNGPYSRDVVWSFYQYYAQVMMPGDMLRFEMRISFNIEAYLETWNRQYLNN